MGLFPEKWMNNQLLKKFPESASPSPQKPAILLS